MVWARMRYLLNVLAVIAVAASANAGSTSEQKLEVVASVRSLVEKIVIYPNNDPKDRDLELVGQLAALLSTDDLCNSMRRVVAEEGLEPPTHGL